jgi:glycosyltransferase 2 family protein
VGLSSGAAGALLYFAFRNTDLMRLSDFALSRSPFPILISVGFTVLSLVFRMKRWQSLLSPLKRIGSGRVFSFMAIGILGNHVLPAKAGDLIGVHLLGRKEEIGRIAVLGTAIMERVLDVLAVLMLTGSVLLASGMTNALVAEAEIVALGLLASAVVGILLFVRSPVLVRRIVTVLIPSGLRDRVSNGLSSLRMGLSTIQGLSHTATVMFWSLLMWASIAGALASVLYAFDIGDLIPSSGVFVLLLFVTIGMAIPAAPAGIGAYEYAVTLALQAVLPEETGELRDPLAQIGAVAIISHATMVLPEVLIGIVCLFKEGLCWGALAELGGVDPDGVPSGELADVP